MALRLACLLAALLPWVAAAGDPLDLGPAQPVIPARTFNLADFGAVPDGVGRNDEAFHRALATLAQAGGGTLVVPAGNYLTGPLELVSNCDLHLAAGSRLLFSQNFDEYRIEGKKYRPLIGAHDAHDLRISGPGTIDGQGRPWWVIERKVKTEARARGLHDAEIGRPRMIVLTGCERVRLEGVTLTNSPMYHFVPTRCRDVTVEGIAIVAPADSPNTDGIDPSASSHVLIAHCRIDTGDDNIAIKAGAGRSWDILITDCTFEHGHGCSIGSDTVYGVSGVTVRRCTFEGTVAGVRLKSARDRGGLVEKVSYRDLTMRNVGKAIEITSYYYDLPKPGRHDAARPVTAKTPLWRGIAISNLTATGTEAAGLIVGLPEAPAAGISLENVRIQARLGLRLSYVADIRLDRVEIQPDRGPPLITDDTVGKVVR